MAIDRTSKVVVAELHPRAKRVVAAEFLRRVLDKLPDKVPTVLTDNGVQFTPQPHQFLPGGHSFDRICREYGVEHRLTKPAHPWTNGQVERMNRTLKEAPVKRFHYQTTEELNEHLYAFLLAYNHAKRLKTLRGLTPHEFVGAQWQKNPPIFTQDPTHLTLGLYTVACCPPTPPMARPPVPSGTKWPRCTTCWAKCRWYSSDSSFNGGFREHLAQRYGVRVENPVLVLVEKTNFCIHARGWIVERTFAWLSANRRLSKEYDRRLCHANAWI